MPSTLPADLVAALQHYRAARETEDDISEALGEILAQFGQLAPSGVGAYDGQIATHAQLWHSHIRMTRLGEVFSRKTSDRKLLKLNPELRYLFMFHRDGYLRQDALDLFSEALPNPFLVGALVWRLNDWVHEVRQSALHSVRRCLPQTSATILAQYFLKTLHLDRRWGRWSEVEREAVENQLRRKDVGAQLVSALMTQHDGPQPSVLAKLLRYDWIDEHLERIAESAINPGVRALAIRSLINGEASIAIGVETRWVDKPMGIKRKVPRILRRPLSVRSDQAELVRNAVADKSALVRRVGLSAIIEHSRDDPEAVALAKSCKDDQSDAVRSRAEFILRNGE